VVIRTHSLLALLGLCAAQLALGQEPGRLGLDHGQALPLKPYLSTNQQLVETIARTLKEGGQLHNYRIDLSCRAGVVEVSGVVANQPQREEALRLIQGVPGVERVVNRLVLAQGEGVVRTQAPPVLPPVNEAAPVLPPAVGPALPAPENKAVAPQDPLPMLPPPGGMHGGALIDTNPPKMPPYSWPTYAPYNNFSRVAYPEGYPYNAWPFIGPIYPFPKVPLGWRSVKLEFDEGYWWFSRVAANQYFISHDHMATILFKTGLPGHIHSRCLGGIGRQDEMIVPCQETGQERQPRS
jgi:hypothetical protein